MANGRRLFLALWPDPAVREALARTAGQAHLACHGRPVAPEHLHLTLAFLGRVHDARLASLVALTEAFPCPAEAFSLDRFGYFPRGGVLWLGSQAPTPRLTTLHHRLWQALACEGLSPPERTFLPHVTLLRHAVPPAPGALPGIALNWHYTQLRLIESVITEEGPRYEGLATSASA
ncbi:RNA 2',3'-cyclic phosphodiesterase [Halomonas sp. YLGW01]|uniref:RNA 2',3'-cyclic phosphodiesterase n=1 Tax=Halomonas sp. YLGW01 TaxID=2773308 RepID=UPI00177FCB02|nr:RNA 2',3'-cyclic phosphodiesterase [Halomonas sp. YLGW01]